MFHASYDRTTKLISAAVAVVLLGVSIATHSLVVGSLSALLVLATYGYSPRGYSVLGRSIVVKRLIGDAHFPLDGISEIRPASPADLQGGIRLFGNGGVFGYYGLFQTPRLGKSTWYLTNHRNAVVVVTSGRTAVFSPDDVDAFIEAVREAIPVPPGAPGRPLPVFHNASRIPKLLGIGVAILGLSFGTFSVLYSPGPPSYTLTPEFLVIHDRFYPVTLNRAGVDVGHIRVVDTAEDRDWQPVQRTNGFANSHYQAGWFRLRSGLKVRVYRANGTRLVLLPPRDQGAAVLLDTADPANFVKQVTALWSNHN